MEAIPPLHPSAEPRYQSSLPRDFYLRSSLFGYLHVIPDLVAMALLLWGIRDGALATQLACALGVGLVAYRLTFVAHDCAHRTLFERRIENELIGWLVTSLLFTNFPAFRRLHWTHHRNYGREGDPQGSDY